MAERVRSSPSSLGPVALSAAWRYGLGVIPVVVTYGLIVFQHNPPQAVVVVLDFILCIVAAAWFGGRGPGFAATITSLAVTWNANTSVPFAFRVVLSLATGGVVSLLVGQARDSRRRFIEAVGRLREGEERYRRIVETADEGIWLLDASGRATYVNGRGAEMLGLTSEGVIGRSLGEFAFTPNGRSALGEALRPVGQGRSTRFDLRLRRADGSLLWARVSASPVPDDDGKTGTLAMLADVTDRVVAEEKLRRSESRFRRLSESGMIGVAVIDAQGRATEANDEFLRLVDGSRADLEDGRVGLTVATPPEYHAQDHRKLRELNDTGICSPFVKEYTRADGGRSAVLVGATRLEEPTADGSNESVGFMLDITARRRAEMAVRFLAEAGEVLGCSLDYDVTLNGVARLAVPRMADRCVIDVLDHEGRTSRVASAPSDDEARTGADTFATDPDVAEVIRTGKSVAVDRRPDPSAEGIASSSFMVVPLSARGRTFGTISLWADGQHRRFDAEDRALAEELARRAALAVDNARLFAEANLARVEAERADRTKNQFLAALSHELRTPLTPVLIDVSAVLDNPHLSEDVRDVLEVTRRNVELEARLIDDLLDVTRITQGKLTLNRSTVDAHVLIRQAVEICRRDSESAGLEIVLDLGSRHSHVEGDSARLQQIFWNLVKNAVKFTPTTGRVDVRTRDEPGPRLVVSVTDTGIGIGPDVLPRIFDAFEQGDASVTKQFGGLGLGLAISRSLAVAHGGRLSATSAGRGHGSTFTLTLPALPGPVPTLAPEPDDAPAPDPAKAAAGLRILLAEDNAETLRILSRLLRGRGHIVSAASDLAGALRAADAADGAFDLVISDIGLPDGTGLDLMSRLRSSRRHAIPGIALSGYGTEDDLRKSREAGFVTHLTKPVDFPTLEAAIRRVAASLPEPHPFAS